MKKDSSTDVFLYFFFFEMFNNAFFIDHLRATVSEPVTLKSSKLASNTAFPLISARPQLSAAL